MTFLGPAMLGMVTTIALMFALRPLAVSTGLIDSPGGRKSHIGDVPVIGGVAMFIGMIAGMAVVPDVSNVHLWMMFAGGVLLAIGIRDDRRHVSSNVRLVAQAMAAAIMALGANLVISDLGDPLGIGVVYLGSWATMFTVLVTISVINAFNFIDGIDGLAGCLAAIAIGAVAIVAVNLTTSVTTIGIIACASILGFLLFNFPVYMNRNVRSFMGDAGSTLLGLIVVWLTISVSQGEHRVISPVIGLWFVLVPLADLFTCFIRRILKGKSPLSPGREHLHYILMRGRLSVRFVLGILSILGGLYAGIGLLGHSLGVPDVFMFGGWVVVMAVQYPLMRKIAVTARGAHKKRRRGQSIAQDLAKPLASSPEKHRRQTDQSFDAR